MNDLDHQTGYWNLAAEKKNFTHPINLDWIGKLLHPQSKILDYGCGYGRTCAQLKEAGFHNVLGVDISTEMIRRGHAEYACLKLKAISGGPLPFSAHSFSACMLFAVLTCVPTDTGQQELIQEIVRVLRPGGILYLSDYPLQQDERNKVRYQKFEPEFGKLGVFRLPDGGVVRHHKMEWMAKLLDPFEIIHKNYLNVATMNGHGSTIVQIVGQKNMRE